MNDTKSILKGLELISEGLSSIIEAFKADAETTTSKVVTSKAKAETKSEETEVAVNKSDSYTAKDLETMGYNDLKKLAKEMGISAAGSRKELTEKLLSSMNTDSEDEEVEEEAPKKPAVKKPSKLSKKSEPEPEDDEDEEDEEPDEEDGEDDIDPVEQQVLEAVEDMSDDELKELLDDIGVNSKGKRQALIAKLVQAVNDGKIDLDDNDDSEDSDSDIEDEGSDITDEEVDITENMTKKRKKAYLDYKEETESAFSTGEISRADVVDFINEFNGTKDKMKNIPEDELLEQYLEITANLIDDDGNIVEEGYYFVNEEPYCCGKPLKYDEDESKYICETCGAEYDAEDE